VPKYVIERNIPGAHCLTAAELKAASEKSNEVLRTLWGDVQWVQSFVTEDKVYCVYNARNPGIVAEHARAAGLPADRISAVRTVIDPNTGE